MSGRDSPSLTRSTSPAAVKGILCSECRFWGRETGRMEGGAFIQGVFRVSFSRDSGEEKQEGWREGGGEGGGKEEGSGGRRGGGGKRLTNSHFQ